MDRLKQTLLVLIGLCCLTGCSTPEKITDSGWEIVDIDTPNTISGNNSSSNGLGSDNWGVDNSPNTEGSGDEPAYTEPAYTEPTVSTTRREWIPPEEDVIADEPIINNDVQQPTFIRNPGELTRDEISELPEEDFNALFPIENDNYYTDKYGKYIYTKQGQFIKPSIYSSDAVYELYTDTYGEPALVVDIDSYVMYYWFLNTKVVSFKHEGYYVYESEAPYTKPTGNWEGNPFYEDFDNVIYKNDDGTYKVLNKLTMEYIT